MLILNQESTAGVDEAGRGCLAGDVCTAAVCFPSNILHNIDDKERNILEIINDSKLLSKTKRKICFDFIKEKAFYAITTCSPEEIDRSNILRATIVSMHKSLQELSTKTCIEKIIVDGNYFTKFQNIEYECKKNADRIYLNAAAASILAKVHRDSLIEEYCLRFPEIDKKYGFSSNKAYGTKQHLSAIKQYGVLDIHRKSFSPMKNCCSSYTLLNHL